MLTNCTKSGGFHARFIQNAQRIELEDGRASATEEKHRPGRAAGWGKMKHPLTRI